MWIISSEHAVSRGLLITYVPAVHHQGGLSKLAEAEAAVDGLSREAEVQRSLLRTKQSEADQALGDITASMQQATERRREVEDLTGKLQREEVELRDRRGGGPAGGWVQAGTV